MLAYLYNDISIAFYKFTLLNPFNLEISKTILEFLHVSEGS